MEEASNATDFGTRDGDTVGLEIVDARHGQRVVYLANCAQVNESVRRRCSGADVVFFDGTLWRDDEMLVNGEGTKTGRRMGHVSMSGPGGAMEGLRDVDIGRRIFIHVNNTNPALLADSDERSTLERAGWEVAYDGQSFSLE